MRESELYGGVLTSSLSREHLALTAEFLRGDECVFFFYFLPAHVRTFGTGWGFLTGRSESQGILR